MDKKEQEFLKRLQSAFKMEAKERIQSLTTGLAELEKLPAGKDMATIIETMFREAHSLKGAARAVNMMDFEAICQSLEDVFDLIKRNELNVSPELIDKFYITVDGLTKLVSPSEGKEAINNEEIALIKEELAGISTGKHPRKLEPVKNKKQSDEDSIQKREKYENPQSKFQISKSKIQIDSDSLKSGAPLFNDPQFDKKQTDLSSMVRISTAKLDSILRQAQEMISLKMSSRHIANDLNLVSSMFGQWLKEWKKVSPVVRQARNRINLQSETRNQDSSHLLGFFDWNYTHVKTIENKITDISKQAENYHNSVDAKVDDLFEDMKKALMLPSSWLFEVFPKLVRDIARVQGKEVKLELQGSETEVDRRILEGIKDSLIHLLRNCVDHGIEQPEERERKKKPSHGTITIAVSQTNGNKVELLVSDDGAGIDIQKVKSSAAKQGIISEPELEKLSDQDALALIFQSSVSTSPIITDISGRGLGLAILQESVKKLGGVISVETQLYKGTLFRMVLPLTLATFRGVFIEVEGEVFVVPTINVERAARIKKEEIKTVENIETVKFNGKAVSLVRLANVLEIQSVGFSKPKQGSGKIKGKDSGFISVLVINAADKQIAVCVDKVLGEEEVLVKKTGKQLSRVKNIMGVTVTGSGKAVGILNAYDLIKSASKVRLSAVSGKDAIDDAEFQQKTILIVEDSITSRMLLKNIIESAGYVVKTAVDGIDAFTMLKEEKFDLVVSDVEMPRMNGFDLTSKIRGDKQLEYLSVVLVTGLGSGKDRERGIDVGANAYIVKSDFDQSNLLDAIERLI